MFKCDQYLVCEPLSVSLCLHSESCLYLNMNRIIFNIILKIWDILIKSHSLYEIIFGSLQVSTFEIQFPCTLFNILRSEYKSTCIDLRRMEANEHWKSSGLQEDDRLGVYKRYEVFLNIQNTSIYVNNLVCVGQII